MKTRVRAKEQVQEHVQVYERGRGMGAAATTTMTKMMMCRWQTWMTVTWGMIWGMISGAVYIRGVASKRGGWDTVKSAIRLSP